MFDLKKKKNARGVPLTRAFPAALMCAVIQPKTKTHAKQQIQLSFSTVYMVPESGIYRVLYHAL